MAEVNYTDLKNGGFMRQVQKDYFSLRIRITAGQLSAQHLAKVSEIAQQYGRGKVHMTARQSIEIPFIHVDVVDAVKKALADSGLRAATCGPGVRTITACQGTSVCSSGCIDTFALADAFDERFYARPLPHKFKLGITGCRNNCLKAEENDLGVKGGVQPSWQEELCTYCSACEKICPGKAITVDKGNKTLNFNQDQCVSCGKCVKICPTKAWEGRSGFILYFGGLYGNRISVGKQLLPIIFDEEQVFKVVETTLEFFKTQGKSKERFGNTLDRVGWELFQKELDQIDYEK